jgi:hypothetical protein
MRFGGRWGTCTRLTHGLEWRGHWLDMLGGQAGRSMKRLSGAQWHSRPQWPKEFGMRVGTRQPPRPHPAASVPRYSMNLIQLIRKVTGKRSLVRDVRQLCPLRPRHIHSVEDTG